MLVMAYPHNETGIKYYSDKNFEDVKEYNEGVEWYIEGDRLEVWYDTEKYEEVVYRRFGGVECMYDRFDTYIRNDTDDSIEEQIAKILKDEALGNGYPERRPPEMTWRDLMVRISELPEDILDTPALVWVDSANKGADGECRIIDISPFDADKPASKDNRPCIDFR